MKKEIARLAGCYLAITHSDNKAATSRRRKRIIDDFFGLNNNGEMTSMASIGAKLGVSREAVRQSIDDFSNFIDRQALTGGLGEARSYSEKQELLFCIGGEREISTCHALFMFRVVKYLLRDEKIKECRINKRLYIAYYYEIDIKRIQSACVKQISHNGAVMLNEICDEHFAAGATPTNLKLLKAILCLKGSDLCAVQTSLGEYVYFCATGRNRLVSRLRKIFFYYSSVKTENLRSALMRDMHRKDSTISMLPPDEVILSVAERAIGAMHENGIVSVKATPVRDSKINVYEDSIVEFIHSSAVNNQGVERREREIERAVKKSEGDAYGFSMAINHSPLVVRIRRGVYQLTGNMRVA